MSDVKAYEINGYVISDVGKVRAANEDNYLIGNSINENSEGHTEAELDIGNVVRWNCFAVYDGIGGAERGEIASKYAAEEMKNAIVDIEPDFTYEAVDNIISATYLSANNRIVNARSEMAVTGTTGTALVTDGIMAKVYHIGDSRAYLLRNNELYLLTSDQTMAQMKIDIGFCKDISEADPKDIHQLTEYIGRDTSGQYFHPVEGEWIDFRIDDVFIICSDGVYDECNTAQIKSVLSQKELTVKQRVQRLYGLSMFKGAKDNVTCMIVEKTQLKD